MISVRQNSSWKTTEVYKLFTVTRKVLEPCFSFLRTTRRMLPAAFCRFPSSISTSTDRLGGVTVPSLALSSQSFCGSWGWGCFLVTGWRNIDCWVEVQVQLGLVLMKSSLSQTVWCELVELWFTVDVAAGSKRARDCLKFQQMAKLNAWEVSLKHLGCLRPYDTVCNETF